MHRMSAGVALGRYGVWVWATLETWLLGDGEVPSCASVRVLQHKGLRLSCDAFARSAETVAGAWPQERQRTVTSPTGF